MEAREVSYRRLKRGERVVHPPKVARSSREECYLGWRVHVINVYERCLHACSYCFAEWPWSPPSVVVRENLVERAERDLKRFYVGRRVVFNLGSATDPYQPVEAREVFMRRLIPLLESYGATFYVCTKSTLILRDLDLMVNYPNRWVGVTITSLNEAFAEVFEPRAPRPKDRVRVVEKLSSEGIPVAVRVDPIIPFVNDDVEELSPLIAEVEGAGARLIVASTLKLDRSGWILDGGPSQPPWKRPLSKALDEWGLREGVEGLSSKLRELYAQGEVLHGYLVPPASYRRRILEAIKAACRSAGFAPCKMGVDLRRELTTWKVDGDLGCACYMYRPSKVKFKVERSDTSAVMSELSAERSR
ncbi:MAG: hypothetical protein DRJ97_01585 [Thermoprotei archaeon]|nr:MAG: hypothetical protein DRJ97_01585 [Thermoprotei archaeon]